MVNVIGSTGGGRIEGARPLGAARPNAAKADALRTAKGADEAPATNPASEMAELGPPTDNARVEELRARIAAGTYRVDPQMIAARMMALDLPEKA